MDFLVTVTPRDHVDRQVLYNTFTKTCTQDKDLQVAVGVQRTFKVVGTEEVVLVIRAESNVYLDRALSGFHGKADIEVTPVVELT